MSKRKGLKFYVSISLVVFCATIFLGCVGPAPKEDYVIAYTAIESAKQAQALRFAPGFYNQAQDYFRQGVVDYEGRKYQDAKNNFRRARIFAEKAENYTMVKKAQTGESE